jgi:DHA1 family tetracycline resistance protein-like MFS transporter
MKANDSPANCVSWLWIEAASAAMPFSETRMFSNRRTSSISQENMPQRLRNWLRSPLIPIFLIMFVDFLGLGITIPVLPVFAKGEFGASAFQVTLIFSVYFLMQFIASPQLGRLSDRIGRKPVLFISQAGTLGAFLISGVAPSLIFLFLARGIDGLTGGNISVAQAYLSDVTDEKTRARGLGIVTAAAGSGLMFGPAFGALLAAEFGPRLAYFAAAVISLITILITYFRLPESLTSEGQTHRNRSGGKHQANPMPILRTPGIPLLMIIACSGPLSFFAFQSIFVLWSEQTIFVGYETRLFQQTVGWILAYVGLMGIITQAFLVKPIVQRFGENWMVTGGLLVRSLAFILMSLLPLISVVILTVPLIAFGTGLFIPGLIALLTYRVPPKERGLAIGLSEAAQGLGRIAGPLISGWLFDNIDPSSPMIFAGIVGLLSMLASYTLRRNFSLQKATIRERESI